MEHETATFDLESALKKIRELETAAAEVEKMREALRSSEALYRSVFEYTGTAMMIIEEDTTIIDGNHRMEEITGHLQEEVAKKRKWTEFVHRDDIPWMMEYHKKRRDNPKEVPPEYEFRLVDRHGSIREVMANVCMIPGTKQSLVSLVDITNRKKMERALRESEQRFKEIAELLPGIICEMDMSMKLTYANALGLSTFGFTREDFDRGIYVTDLVPEGLKEKVLQDTRNIFSGDYGNAQVYRLYKKDRTPIDILINSAPILKDGARTGIRTCIIDISDRMKAEEKLRESEERFRSIYASSPIGIAVYSLDGNRVDMNESFDSMFGTGNSNDLIKEQNLFGILGIGEKDIDDIKAGNGFTKEIEIEEEKDTRYFEWLVTPLNMTALGPSSLLVQVQDITENRKAEDARLQKERDATAKAEALVDGLRHQLIDKTSFHDMVSRSPQMKQIFDILPEVANAAAAVLITGESGTGKELVARSLHELSPRKSKPFIAINCSALPDTLLESELFGYKAGAFTDAKKDKPGKFALAEGGTIFLDEIGDISAAMQVKLLRVLQEKIYEPLGATSAVKANVRILAATNKDLTAMVKSGEFREDLFYRINVVTIKLPSLRERRCDIPPLCEHFIERFNDRYGKKISGIATEALDVLMEHEFPGNIRELENSIEHAFIFCKEPQIGIQHLPASMRSQVATDEIKTLSGIRNFEELEKLYLKSILLETGGNRMKAAQRLGVHKATLFRKMRQLGIH